MVLRERKINLRSDEVQVHCSFSLPDVKALLKMYAVGESEAVEAVNKQYPHTEQDITHWFENDGRAFASWPSRWRQELGRWCFAVGVRNKLLVPTATDENRYFLADCLFAKRGRPKADD
jgi:hypothetical protein